MKLPASTEIVEFHDYVLAAPGQPARFKEGKGMEKVWAAIEANRCGFDIDGIAAVSADVRKLYHGESRYFLTGWEAGGHTVWALLLGHPEEVRARH